MRTVWKPERTVQRRQEIELAKKGCRSLETPPFGWWDWRKRGTRVDAL
jgi:hypothetical protein